MQVVVAVTVGLVRLVRPVVMVVQHVSVRRPAAVAQCICRLLAELVALDLVQPVTVVGGVVVRNQSAQLALPVLVELVVAR